LVVEAEVVPVIGLVAPAEQAVAAMVPMDSEAVLQRVPLILVVAAVAA
jgi:hypothetical protein